MNATNPGKGTGQKTIDDRVKMQDGKVEVESAPGKGTLITIALPLTRNSNPK